MTKPRRLQRLPVELSEPQPAVIVAVIAVRVMEMSIDQIVHMVAVRNSFVSAAGPMLMGTLQIRRARVRIF
jgi:hypothetical protein